VLVDLPSRPVVRYGHSCHSDLCIFSSLATKDIRT
jgi:hypothetical protein